MQVKKCGLLHRRAVCSFLFLVLSARKPTCHDGVQWHGKRWRYTFLLTSILGREVWPPNGLEGFWLTWTAHMPNKVRYREWLGLLSVHLERFQAPGSRTLYTYFPVSSGKICAPQSRKAGPDHRNMPAALAFLAWVARAVSFWDLPGHKWGFSGYIPVSEVN